MTDAPPRPDPTRRRPTAAQRAFYWFIWSLTLVLMTLIYRVRRFGMRNIPATGPVLLASNHQSHLDPPLCAIANPWRPTHFLARAGLFKNPFFAWFITALNSVPIKEESGDLAAIREILARLEERVPVLLFPEGSRTPDGEMHEFKRGIALLLKRAKCPVVPMAVEGCYHAFPRSTSFPKLWGARIAVIAGRPIDPDDLLRDGPDAALKRLEREVETLRLELRSKMRAGTAGRLPPKGPGDAPRVARAAKEA